MKFINCTAHKLLPEQIEVAKTMGVTEFVELPDELKSVLMNTPGDKDKMYELVNILIKDLSSLIIINEPTYLHLPIGSPAFMYLFQERWLRPTFVKVLFSHSNRESVEQTRPGGTVNKISMFKFANFIEI